MDDIDNVVDIEKGVALASEKIEIDDFKNEQNLILYPFCATTKRPFFETLSFVSEDKRYFLEVSPNAKYGMAKTWDFDILRFVLSKIDTIFSRTGYRPPSVRFSAYEYFNYLGQNSGSGKNIQRLKDALDRLASTTYKGNIFNEDTRAVVAFTLAKYEYVETKKGVMKIELTVDDRLLKSLKRSDSLISIDRRVIGEQSGIKKRLLELVPLKLDDSNKWIVSVNELQKLCANNWVFKRFKSEIKSFRDLPWDISEEKFEGEPFLKFSKKRG